MTEVKAHAVTATTQQRLDLAESAGKAALPLQLDADRFAACLVLASVGDALGYKNGDFEFCKSGTLVHEQFAKLSGGDVGRVTINLAWRCSDDTVLHLATARALASVEWKSLQDIGVHLAMEVCASTTRCAD